MLELYACDHGYPCDVLRRIARPHIWVSFHPMSSDATQRWRLPQVESGTTVKTSRRRGALEKTVTRIDSSAILSSMAA